MKKLVTTLAILSIALSSCGGSNELSIMTPVGAPAIAVYKYATSKSWEPQDQPRNIRGALTEGTKDVIIFESISGLRLISGEIKAPYKLAKVITNGNLYMVSLKGKTSSDEIASDAKIVSFGQDLIPDVAIKNLYPELVDQISYVNGADDAASIVCSGLHEGSEVDYVIGAMPSLYIKAKEQTCKTYGNVNIVKNIQDDMEEKTGIKGIPQAGVFIRNSTYENKKDQVDEFMKTIDESIDAIKANPTAVYEELLEVMEAQSIQQKFGFTRASLEASFSDGANLVGLTNDPVDINAFLTALGQSTISDEYFLNY